MKDKMKLYAVAMITHKNEDIKFTTAAITTYSEESAKNIGLKEFIKRYPSNEGWEGHKVIAMEINPETIKKIAAEIAAENEIL